MRNSAGLALVVIGLSSFASPAKAANERLWVNAEINGKPARFVWDTGFASAALTRDAAKRFGLKTTNAPAEVRVAPGHARLGMTEECSLSLENAHWRTSLNVIDFPSSLHVDFDGLIGWSPLKDSTVRIYASTGVLTFPQNVEEQLAGWTRFPIATNSDTLELEIPRTNGPRTILSIDTGNDMGILLPPQRWQAWKRAHPHSPMTAQASFRPADGYLFQEISWATNFSLGPLVITDVPIAEAPPSDVVTVGPDYEGTLGLTALKRLDVILDGERSVAHVRPKTTPPGPYKHNRAGVVFLPSPTNVDIPFARVIEGSPAWEAGIRNGDTLLKCNGETVPMYQLGEGHLEETPGTKVELTLKRGRKTFNATVTLRQIVPPAPP